MNQNYIKYLDGLRAVALFDLTIYHTQNIFYI